MSVGNREQPANGDRRVDPMFDGHLERPFETMTDAERQQWAWEGAQLLHWARRARFIDQPDEHRESKNEKRRAE